MIHALLVHSSAFSGSSHRSFHTSVAMHSNVLGSAHDPLLPLTRWIQYTQTELQSVRADLIHHREEELAVRRLQQSQLDSLQLQIRELAQQQTEFSEQMTEVANAVTDMFHQLGVLRNTFNHAMNDMLRHFESPQQLPPTQLAATQPEDVPVS